MERNKGALVFRVRGQVVDPRKIERWMREHDVMESRTYSPGPAAGTMADLAKCRVEC
jgi:hypothetical protein